MVISSNHLISKCSFQGMNGRWKNSKDSFISRSFKDSMQRNVDSMQSNVPWLWYFLLYLSLLNWIKALSNTAQSLQLQKLWINLVWLSTIKSTKLLKGDFNFFAEIKATDRSRQVSTSFATTASSHCPRLLNGNFLPAFSTNLPPLFLLKNYRHRR